MQTTKLKILHLLKRRGRLAVDALSDELGLAPMTVRQHLTFLERDRLIEATPERQPKGRPHYLYALTQHGEESFPKRYDWLAAELLGVLGRIDPLDLAGLDSEQRTEFLLGRIADRAAAQDLARLQHLPLDERVREAAAILQRESGFVEWSKTSDGYQIDDYNCMYRALTGENSDVCTWHRHVIARLVGVPAVLSAAEGSGTHCRYTMQSPTDSDISRDEPLWPARENVAQMISEEVHS